MTLTLILTIGGAAGALLTIGALIRAAWRANRRIVRIANAVDELVPNGGNSIKDQVTRIEGQITTLTKRFDDHLADHRTRGVDR
ncbi:hypothetical protein AB0I72_20085 [Nocardiopsis sp. NPDC049922]|uniref:hypothetical protein n=1 Tax=Nocardiopsis sp. NPDC049922 TaxID=3155157 RepID=UPI0033F31567